MTKTETRRDGTVQLADWWQDLLWPRVLSAAALGVRPSRIGLAFFGLVAGLVVVALGTQFDKWVGKTTSPSLSAIAFGSEGWLSFVWNVIVAYPAECISARPFTTLMVVLLAIPFELVVVGAITRIVALEFSRGEFITWTEGLSFSLARIKSLLGAIAGPLALVWGIALILAAAGWLLLNWPYVNLVGSFLYAIALLLAMISGIVAIAFLIGGSLLVPAVVCDGSDAIDAVQRAYAYTLDRPMRLIGYYLLAAFGFVFVFLVVTIIVGTGIGFAYAAAGAWLGPDAQSMLTHGTLSALPGGAENVGLAGTWKGGSWMIRLWTMVPVYLLLACGVSCAIAAKAIVYLAIRRICDGQDTGELWMPGVIENTMQDALRARAEVSKVASSPGAVVEEPDDE